MRDGGKTDCVTEPKKVLKADVLQGFELQEKTVLSHNTAIYRFKLPTSKSILGLPIGQHISVAAYIEEQQKDVVRSYTPISSDENKGYFDLLIKSYPQGNVSKYMASMKIGQLLRVKGPKGAMVYTPNLVRHFGMIAGGTGITPMLQIIRAIIRGRPRNGGNDRTEVDLIFANVNQEDVLLKEDLDALANEDDKFRVHYVLNNPPEKWDGGVGFVTADMIKVRLPRELAITWLTDLQGQAARPSERYQASALWPTAHGKRNEESHRILGLSEGETSQQT